MNFKPLVIASSIIAILSSCCGKYYSPPELLALQIASVNDSSDLIYNKYVVADSIALYYVDSGVKKNLKIELDTDTVSKTVTILSGGITLYSTKGIKDFYLYLNQTDVRPIYLDVEEVDKSCSNNYILHELKINNKVITRPQDTWVYKYYIEE